MFGKKTPKTKEITPAKMAQAKTSSVEGKSVRAPKQKQKPEVTNASSIQARQAKSDFYVACIGASAGGLDAVTELIADFPLDSGVALIFIQHLPDNLNSLLAGILSKRAALPVHEAVHGMLIEPNNLYVIPSARNMTIGKDGKLKLVKRVNAPAA